MSEILTGHTVTPPCELSWHWRNKFWARVNILSATECWIWKGSTIKGYGQVHVGRVDGKSVTWYAHRMAWHIFGRPLHEGMTLDHLCKVPLCVNPWHLEEVTNAENLRRAHAGATHCQRGHEFTEANTMVRTRANGTTRRVCRSCANASQRRRYTPRGVTA